MFFSFSARNRGTDLETQRGDSNAPAPVFAVGIRGQGICDLTRRPFILVSCFLFCFFQFYDASEQLFAHRTKVSIGTGTTPSGDPRLKYRIADITSHHLLPDHRPPLPPLRPLATDRLTSSTSPDHADHQMCRRRGRSGRKNMSPHLIHDEQIPL